MTNISIRHAEAGDYDGIIANVDIWWGHRHMSGMPPRLFFSYFRPWTYVAVHNQTVVGFLAASQSQSNPRQVYCHFIGVDPGWRGQGVGEALYQRLFVAAVAEGCHDVLAVTASTNRGSIAFHTRMGFAPLPGLCTADEVPFTPAYDGPGEDRVLFRKSLRDPPVP